MKIVGPWPFHGFALVNIIREMGLQDEGIRDELLTGFEQAIRNGYKTYGDDAYIYCTDGILKVPSLRLFCPR